MGKVRALDVQLNFTLFATEANFTGIEANFATFGPCNPCLDIQLKNEKDGLQPAALSWMPRPVGVRAAR